MNGHKSERRLAHLQIRDPRASKSVVADQPAAPAFVAQPRTSCTSDSEMDPGYGPISVILPPLRAMLLISC